MYKSDPTPVWNLSAPPGHDIWEADSFSLIRYAIHPDTGRWWQAAYRAARLPGGAVAHIQATDWRPFSGSDVADPIKAGSLLTDQWVSLPRDPRPVIHFGAIRMLHRCLQKT